MLPTGRARARRPAECRRLGFFNVSTSLCWSPAWIPQCLLRAFIPERSEGPHSVSSRDNGVPSVTTVRITEHNRGSAAVMPAQGKQQEAVVVDSAVMKLALRQTDLASVATSAYLLMLNTRQEKTVLIAFGPLL